MSLAAGLCASYLRAQVRAGVDAIQLFDSWAGLLPKKLYDEEVLPYTREVFDSIKSDVPKIHFSANSAGMLDSFAKTGCTVLGLGSDVNAIEAYDMFGGRLAVQGNLKPELALEGGAPMRAETLSMLNDMHNIDGFIFNLGHGVLKDTKPEALGQIVSMVKDYKAH